MLTKTAVLLLAIAACEKPSGVPGAGQGSSACRVSDYSCYPADPLARSTCEHVCGQTAHCQDYTPAEYRFCATHPGVPMGGTKRCTLDGLPSWISHCAPGL